MLQRLLILTLALLFSTGEAEAQTKAQPRAVNARGALDAEEMNNIGVFKIGRAHV